MALGSSPKDDQISQKKFGIMTPIPYVFSFSVSLRIWWYVGHEPWSGPGPTRSRTIILKTVKFPTPKPYVFLFIVSRDIKWYVGYGLWGGPDPT